MPFTVEIFLPSFTFSHLLLNNVLSSLLSNTTYILSVLYTMRDLCLNRCKIAAISIFKLNVNEHLYK
jgi:hypothetical protein